MIRGFNGQEGMAFIENNYLYLFVFLQLFISCSNEKENITITYFSYLGHEYRTFKTSMSVSNGREEYTSDTLSICSFAPSQQKLVLGKDTIRIHYVVSKKIKYFDENILVDKYATSIGDDSLFYYEIPDNLSIYWAENNGLIYMRAGMLGISFNPEEEKKKKKVKYLFEAIRKDIGFTNYINIPLPPPECD